jgi:hypothetical protein
MTRVVLAEARSRRPDLAEIRLSGPAREPLSMEASTVLRPGPHPPLLASLCNPLARCSPGICWASVELPDLMPQTLQVIHTAIYNLLKFA